MGLSTTGAEIKARKVKKNQSDMQKQTEMKLWTKKRSRKRLNGRPQSKSIIDSR